MAQGASVTGPGSVLLRYRGGEVYALGQHTGKGWLLSVCGVEAAYVIPARASRPVAVWHGTLAELVRPPMVTKAGTR